MILGHTCETCVFWRFVPALNRKPASPHVGLCRRHSPKTLITAEGRVISRFPITDENNCCGDHATFDEACGQLDVTIEGDVPCVSNES